jgi:hypothetical protein
MCCILLFFLKIFSQVVAFTGGTTPSFLNEIPIFDKINKKKNYAEVIFNSVFILEKHSASK